MHVINAGIVCKSLYFGDPFRFFPFLFIELFFCKKIPLSRRVEYVKDGSMDHSVSELVSE